MVTYYWYRFADQPALLNADLTEDEREQMQAKVEKLHRTWTKDRDYLAPPTVGKLADLDPAQIVTPPKGLEIGYVPIATRQELGPLQFCQTSGQMIPDFDHSHPPKRTNFFPTVMKSIWHEDSVMRGRQLANHFKLTRTIKLCSRFTSSLKRWPTRSGARPRTMNEVEGVRILVAAKPNAMQIHLPSGWPESIRGCPGKPFPQIHQR